jgi:hypothetical protein
VRTLLDRPPRPPSPRPNLGRHCPSDPRQVFTYTLKPVTLADAELGAGAAAGGGGACGAPPRLAGSAVGGGGGGEDAVVADGDIVVAWDLRLVMEFAELVRRGATAGV